MSDNVYAPPQADLRTPLGGTRPQFYVVSAGKFFALFVLSLGLYQVYWSYRNWRLYKASTGAPVWPLMRGLFPIFFVHALYRHADDSLKARGLDYPGRPMFWATAFVAVSLFSSLLDALVKRNIGYPLTDIASLGFLFIQALVVYKGQQLINFAADDPVGYGNSRMQLLNYLCVVPGVLIWALMLAGLFIEVD
ncbi:MAG: hypothetical protein PW845_06390 [Pseudomonas sp.]|uniref:hypothetical protein n=1 Tax=Pseudomonas abieticivorans TaxID=2931382 RepID=UPI0020BDB781|nr:hypothetical protein [Pseudomonas sp. PIA16]MDE1165016.1 hypothetical protein [Pseudomonas sp.]